MTMVFLHALTSLCECTSFEHNVSAPQALQLGDATSQGWPDRYAWIGYWSNASTLDNIAILVTPTPRGGALSDIPKNMELFKTCITARIIPKREYAITAIQERKPTRTLRRPNILLAFKGFCGDRR